jgi:hypothetical protein
LKNGGSEWESNPLTNVNPTTCRRTDDIFTHVRQSKAVLFDCELIVDSLRSATGLSAFQKLFPVSRVFSLCTLRLAADYFESGGAPYRIYCIEQKPWL